jgi:hypothetical protein
MAPEHVQRKRIGGRDIRGISGERCPAKRAAALAEERPDVFRYEAGDLEGVGHASFFRLRSNVVAVVEGDGAAALEREHRAHVDGHGLGGPRNVRVRVGTAQRLRFSQREARGDVTVERIVCRRLIGDDIDSDPATHELGQHVGGIRFECDRSRAQAISTRAKASFASCRAFVDAAWRGAVAESLRIDSMTSAIPSFMVIASGWAPPSR